MDHIRNFCIIAHIDHGKSTLADRLLEFTGTLDQRLMREQVLDSMDLEREKGITIKSHAIQMNYALDGKRYVLNLIDTPGHVDFSYEVSRAIASCEGALLVVDATQGIQAQTLANLYLAQEHQLTIIPVINKIDLPNAEPELVAEEVMKLLQCDLEEILFISAKTGEGIPEVLKAIVRRIPPPQGNPDAPLKALIFDSYYDDYRGVVAYFRIFDGTLEKGMRLQLLSTGAVYEAQEVGILRLNKIPQDKIECGSVGYLVTGVKEVRKIRVGDTITGAENPTSEPIAGFRAAKPMVYAGIYPVNPDQYGQLRDALEKLQLNDAALTFEPESSSALGFGFRVGFLGMLHMEIVQERLEREFKMEVVTTVPNVTYKVLTKKGEERFVHSPAELPDESAIERIEEPYIEAHIFTLTEYVGAIMQLAHERRGELKAQHYIGTDRVELVFEMPLSEVIFDFFDHLKSLSRGYASLDYEVIGYKPSDLVKMNLLINGKPVDALSVLIHRDRAYAFGKKLCVKLKELIPRQLFEVAIQAAIGSRVIARETIKALRKDVTAKCYGGDVTRKRKLLEKQKEGKKRMRQIGKVEIPQDAFMAVLSIKKGKE